MIALIAKDSPLGMLLVLCYGALAKMVLCHGKDNQCKPFSGNSASGHIRAFRNSGFGKILSKIRLVPLREGKRRAHYAKDVLAH